MKFLIEATPTLPVITPRVSTGPDEIYFQVEDRSGTIWYVATLSARTGRLRRCSNLPSTLGLTLDAKGRIVMENE